MHLSANSFVFILSVVKFTAKMGTFFQMCNLFAKKKKLHLIFKKMADFETKVGWVVFFSEKIYQKTTYQLAIIQDDTAVGRIK